ncbi:hypothetical protein ACJZ2D_000445 [Fusarium nematophilum]
MRTILVILLSLGLVIAQAPSVPQCATDCLDQNIPQAGCAVDDISCQCAAGFQEKLFFLALPCFTMSCAPTAFLQAKNAFGFRCTASSSAPSVAESATSIAVEESSTTEEPLTTTSDALEETSTTQAVVTSPSEEAVGTSTATTLRTTTRPGRTTPATPNASTVNEQPTGMRESAEGSDASEGDLDTGAKAGIGVGVSFGVIGAMCFGATLWLRRRNREPQDMSPQSDSYQGKELHIGPRLPTGLVEMNGVREPAEVEGQTGATEIDGRLAPQEMPA